MFKQPGRWGKQQAKVLQKIEKQQKGGGGNVSCNFGGSKRTIERALQNQFCRPQKVGLIWSVPVSFKENDRVWTNGGENMS